MTVFRLISKTELITEEGKITFGLMRDIIDNKIYISIPADDINFKLLGIGQSIKCIVYDKNKVWGFVGTITNRIIGNDLIYEISTSSEIEKIQRREYVRVHTTIPIRYTDNKYLLNIGNYDNSQYPRLIQEVNKNLKDGMIIDISGGGIKFSCADNFLVGQEILLIFKLYDSLFIEKSEIVYKDINANSDGSTYSYGTKFLDISEKSREKIINYAFIIMRKNKLEYE